MKTIIIKAVDFNGNELDNELSIKIQGDFTDEDIRKIAIEHKPLFKEIIQNEPVIVYDENGRIANVDEIKNAHYVIWYPLE